MVFDLVRMVLKCFKGASCLLMGVWFLDMPQSPFWGLDGFFQKPRVKQG